jgi:hypothetical protein
MINPSEVWQVEVQNQIFEANIEELCQWITEGALLPSDKVRRGNLRWLEANKVPLLNRFFNAKERGMPFPVLPTLTDAKTSENNSPIKTENFATAQTVNQTAFTAEEQTAINRENAPFGFQQTNDPPLYSCAIHAQEEPKYICDACANMFCKTCPSSYGSSVKICPMCGEMCKPLADVNAKKQRNFQYQHAVSEGFGFNDFGNALVYPLKFKPSLFFGAGLFAFFTLGQSTSGLGGIFMFAASVFCAMLANTLTFGCLANTIENFSQGKIESNFMPAFEDFELWDDVIHPFFLSLGTYIVSFGLLAVFVAGAIYYAMKSFSQIETERDKIISTVLPGVGNDLNTAKQVPHLNEISNSLNKQSEWQNGNVPDANAIAEAQRRKAATEEAEFQKLEAVINQSRQSQLESVVGKSPETERKDFDKIAANLLRLSMIFSIPIFLAFLWGVFYFPAACAVAGYTRSFVAVLNPMIGLDTIKRLGFNYAKILAMFFLIGVLSMSVSFVLGIVFAPFDLPRMGNLPVKIVGSFFTFYFSIVFSVVLGYALYKNADCLNLNRG